MPVVARMIPAGDLRLSGDNEGTYPSSTNGGSYVLIEGVHQIRQRIASRLKFFLGEWFIDLRQGLPYFRPGFLGKSPSIDLIRSTMRRAILQTPGVLSLVRLDFAIDPSTRRGSLYFQAICEGGVLVVKPGDKDFIVDQAG